VAKTIILLLCDRFVVKQILTVYDLPLILMLKGGRVVAVFKY